MQGWRYGGGWSARPCRGRSRVDPGLGLIGLYRINVLDARLAAAAAPLIP
jgi:hypothetical protein